MTEPKPFASLSSGLLARKGSARPAMRPQGFGKIGSGMDDLGWNDMGHNRAAEAEEPSPFEAPHDAHVPSPISALTPMTSGFQEEEDFEATLSPPPPVVEQQRAAIEASFGEPAEDRFVLATKTRKVAEEAEESFEEAVEERDILELGASHLEPKAEVPDSFEAQPSFQAQPALEPQPEVEAEPEPVVAVLAAEPAPAVSTPVAEARPANRTARSKAAFTLRLDGDRHLKLRLACAVSGRSAQQLVTEALDQLLHSRPEVGALADQVPPKSGKLN